MGLSGPGLNFLKINYCQWLLPTVPNVFCRENVFLKPRHIKKITWKSMFYICNKSDLGLSFFVTKTYFYIKYIYSSCFLLKNLYLFSIQSFTGDICTMKNCFKVYFCIMKYNCFDWRNYCFILDWFLFIKLIQFIIRSVKQTYNPLTNALVWNPSITPV